MSQCLSSKTMNHVIYQCTLEAYHGGNCNFEPASMVTARHMIAQRTTAQLVEDFEASDDAPRTPELAIVRGWLMDELETRNKAAFDCWLESNEASPRKFFIIE